MSTELTKFRPALPRYNNAVTAAAVALKATNGFLYKVYGFQPAANAATYIQWFNVPAANVVLGTTVPDYVQYIPAGASGFIDDFNNNPPFFNTAMSYAACTTATGAVAPANAVQLSILYA
jgi:hypothetical protein